MGYQLGGSCQEEEKEMKNPKVGERVAIYHGDDRLVGNILSVSVNGFICINPSGYWHHPIQCRRLRPKAKKVPREIYANDYGDDDNATNRIGWLRKADAKAFADRKDFIRTVTYREVIE